MINTRLSELSCLKADNRMTVSQALLQGCSTYLLPHFHCMVWPDLFHCLRFDFHRQELWIARLFFFMSPWSGFQATQRCLAVHALRISQIWLLFSPSSLLSCCLQLFLKQSLSPCCDKHPHTESRMPSLQYPLLFLFVLPQGLCHGSFMWHCYEDQLRILPTWWGTIWKMKLSKISGTKSQLSRAESYNIVETQI